MPRAGLLVGKQEFWCLQIAQSYTHQIDFDFTIKTEFTSIYKCPVVYSLRLRCRLVSKIQITTPHFFFKLIRICHYHRIELRISKEYGGAVILNNSEFMIKND